MSISALLWKLHTFFKVCLVRVLLCVFALRMGDWFEVCLPCYFILYFSAWRSLYMACCDTQAHFTPLCFSSPVGHCRLSLRRNEGLTQFEQFAFNGCFLTRTDDPASFRLWSWNELPATFDCPSLLRACVGSPFACPWEPGGGRNAGGTSDKASMLCNPNTHHERARCYSLPWAGLLFAWCRSFMLQFEGFAIHLGHATTRSVLIERGVCVCLFFATPRPFMCRRASHAWIYHGLPRCPTEGLRLCHMSLRTTKN